MKDKAGILVIGMGGPRGEGMGRDWREVSVPMSSLASFDGESDVSPEKGDTVDFQVSGKILAVDGETARVAVESVNGKPIENEPPEPDSETEENGMEDEEEAFRASAEDIDDEGGMMRRGM